MIISANIIIKLVIIKNVCDFHNFADPIKSEKYSIIEINLTFESSNEAHRLKLLKVMQ